MLDNRPSRVSQQLRYNLGCMAIQTIPSIKDMTPAQRVELMEALWQEMSQRPEDVPIPDWHLEVLAERETALANGELEFIDWDEAKSFIRAKTIDRPE